MEVTEHEWVTVKTTLPQLPLPRNGERPVIRTKRLVLRPFTEDDFDALRILRLQPEVMVRTHQGRIDASVDETKASLALQLAPNDEVLYNCAICLPETGEFIGIGGNGGRFGELGWPVIGYMFRKEFWGKGYATEFLKAFLEEIWWKLPRDEVFINVDRSTLRGEGEGQEELVSGITEIDNQASQNVMAKCGFELVKMCTEPDARDPSTLVTLYCFARNRLEG